MLQHLAHRTERVPTPVTWAVILMALFAAPACSLWFTDTAQTRMELHSQRLLDAQAEKEALALRRTVWTPLGTPSRRRAPPPPAPVAPNLEEAGGLAAFCAAGGPEAKTVSRFCRGIQQSRWVRQAAPIALLNGALIVLLILGARVASGGALFLQRAVFKPGWIALRGLSGIQFVLNAVLGLWVLYWWAFLVFGMEPGLWSGLFAAFCGFVLLATLLHLGAGAGPPIPHFLSGAIALQDDDAPELIQNLERLAERIGTQPPDQLIIGLEPTLFLLDEEIRLSEIKVMGRSLYLGVEALRRLEREELDALVLHELAHHGKGPAAHARGLGVQERAFRHRLATLDPAAFLGPSHAVMRTYCEGALEGARRRRIRSERAADEVAADQASPQLLARALVKLASIQAFYDRTEEESIEEELRTDRPHDPSAALRRGPDAYLRSRTLERDLQKHAFHHRRDTHPLLPDRLNALGEGALLEQLPRSLFASPRSAWFNTIARAELLERSLWKRREADETWGDDEELSDAEDALDDEDSETESAPSR